MNKRISNDEKDYYTCPEELDLSIFGNETKPILIQKLILSFRFKNVYNTWKHIVKDLVGEEDMNKCYEIVKKELFKLNHTYSKKEI